MSKPESRSTVLPAKKIISSGTVTKKETPSFHSIFEKKKTEPKDKDTEIVRGEDFNEEISQEMAQQKLNTYLKENKVPGAAKNILSKPIKLNGSVIELTITNSVEITMIQTIEIEVMAFLRKELKNTSIAFKYNIVEDEAERRPYTSIEIFKAMAKKNPALLKLRDEFGLDTEY